MTIEMSELTCPDCGGQVQVVYVTELKQIVSGWACTDCGFVASKRDRFQTSVPLSEPRTLLLRIEKPLSTEDVRDPLGTVEDEFRARASAEMDDDEVWLLIDPEQNELVDLVAGTETDSDDAADS